MPGAIPPDDEGLTEERFESISYSLSSLNGSLLVSLTRSFAAPDDAMMYEGIDEEDAAMAADDETAYALFALACSDFAL